MARNSMMVQTTPALLLLVLIFFTWNYPAAASDGAADCCLTIGPKKIPRNMVKSYYIQTQGMGCRVSATVFVTKKDKKLCAPPATKNNWVQKLIHKMNGKPRRRSKGRKQ
ncbi:C-C motif chemokine 19b [Trichomycterus rosablanca]|uniref:C-C motif chemokine 19b n=1 Tax=Trichomycterus rosablanca TaxID=2290929 RepID=UPI002F357A96